MNTKSCVCAAALAAAGAFPAASSAELSANFGWASEYIFRGVFQEDSSASAGIDYTGDNGLYIGTWGADVGDGLETDLYFGYAGESGPLSYGVGFTGYYYTDDFDDTYRELNVNIGYGDFVLDVAAGEWDGFGNPADYTFASVTFSPEIGPYYKIGGFGRDFDGDYAEIGYGFDFMGADLSVALIYSDELAVSDADDEERGEYALVFGFTKSIALRRSVQ